MSPIHPTTLVICSVVGILIFLGFINMVFDSQIFNHKYPSDCRSRLCGNLCILGACISGKLLILTVCLPLSKLFDPYYRYVIIDTHVPFYLSFSSVLSAPPPEFLPPPWDLVNPGEKGIRGFWPAEVVPSSGLSGGSAWAKLSPP